MTKTSNKSNNPPITLGASGFMLPGTMGLGLVLASAIKSQLSATNSLVDKDNQDSANSKFEIQNPGLVLFQAKAIGTAATVDGCISYEEESAHESMLNNLISSGLDENFVIQLRESLKGATPFSEMKKRYRALSPMSEKDIEFTQELIAQTLRADHMLCETEMAFEFRMRLLLQGQQDWKLFLIVKEPSHEPMSEYLTTLTPEQVSESYPLTEAFSLEEDTFYTLHPGKNNELVPIEYFLTGQFALNKHTELIEAARNAGASRVIVETTNDLEESTFASNSFNANASIGKGKKKIISSSVALDTLFNNDNKSNEVQSLEITFEGNRPGKFSDWMGRSSNEIIAGSRWLNQDAELVSLVRSMFGENRATAFEQVVRYRETITNEKAIGIATNCNLFKLDAKIANDYKKLSNKIANTKIRYRIEF
ncbi:hypothetical protein [Thalassolituus oleivorans]|uniref:hypothetical protein n=1 Tax=Thalassolituus oleivorans TaxID=187493 RepID=UPI0023F32FCB|nr:hypothetical protein [Thalassolituus oleivorans]